MSDFWRPDTTGVARAFGVPADFLSSRNPWRDPSAAYEVPMPERGKPDNELTVTIRVERVPVMDSSPIAELTEEQRAYAERLACWRLNWALRDTGLGSPPLHAPRAGEVIDSTARVVDAPQDT